MSQLKTNLQEILEEKQQKIVAENIKKDVTIFGVTGTLEGGIDTSDANAVADDLAIGKTAYVNGVKVTGTVPVSENEESEEKGLFLVNTDINDWDNQGAGDDYKDFLLVQNRSKVLYRSGAPGKIRIDFSKMAGSLGVHASKIVAGQSIMNVQGTAQTLEDLDECLELTNQILGNA